MKHVLVQSVLNIICQFTNLLETSLNRNRRKSCSVRIKNEQMDLREGSCRRRQISHVITSVCTMQRRAVFVRFKYFLFVSYSVSSYTAREARGFHQQTSPQVAVTPLPRIPWTWHSPLCKVAAKKLCNSVSNHSAQCIKSIFLCLENQYQ